ncbi:mechanosensitive ion channel family protein [Pengzhenrongella frigida]|uniref:Mechanosensitive ion channel n=1 Tax=Pengzhenrongella frigida TaxID=1259133 RepID=A0A4Q5MZY4_9MICO|nr:mechanosensitive ion channel domain-containing protein [Cellulomonas sp. HLT2-17]RYV51432.1 mechanosensitive ion channel [Cellulomonas sp. HLT2-17]
MFLDVNSAVDVTATETADVVGPIGAVVGAVVAALVLATIISAVVRTAARRSNLAMDLLAKVRRPLRAVLVIIAVWIALRLSTETSHWTLIAEHLLLILLIAAAAWLIGALAFVVEDAALSRFRMDVPDNARARRVRTQITVLRRLTVAILAICAIAGILMTFPDARAAGTSLFASAGVLTIVAGLAAQSSLANVFAGLQLAFTDAIRVDDVVIVEQEWGRIEEITMTYVVVHLWDDRRLIVPSTHFTTTPFQNWTRRDANLLGTVELDLDWEVPVEAMRAELTRLLAVSDLWDNRVGVLQVTEATGGFVQVRALASAVDAPTLFDLRCYVREGLVEWVQRTAPQSLPRTRIEGSSPVVSAASPAAQPALPDGDLARAVGQAPATVAVPREPTPPVEPEPPVRTRRLAPADPSLQREPSEGSNQPDQPRPPAASPAAASAEPPTRRTTRRTPGPDDTVQFTMRTDSRLFTGSLDAVERAQAFAGPGPEVLAEREHTAERALAEPEPTDTTETPRH